MNYYFVQQYDIGFIGLRLDNIDLGIEWIYFGGTTKAKVKSGVIPLKLVEKLCQTKYLTKSILIKKKYFLVTEVATTVNQYVQKLITQKQSSFISRILKTLTR